MLKRSGSKNILKVEGCLSELLEAEQTTRDLFTWKPQARLDANLSAAMDRVQQRFGRKALTVGIEPRELPDLGAKIAFRRVPDASEFED
jgi:hypothetical protein